MPTYEYRCNDCDNNFDVVQSFTDEPLSECPTCGNPVRKVFGSVGIVFKGSGFYKTDTRGSKVGSKAGSVDGAGGSGSEAASDGAGKGAASTNGSTSGAKDPSSGDAHSSGSPSTDKKPASTAKTPPG